MEPNKSSVTPNQNTPVPATTSDDMSEHELMAEVPAQPSIPGNTLPEGVIVRQGPSLDSTTQPSSQTPGVSATSVGASDSDLPPIDDDEPEVVEKVVYKTNGPSIFSRIKTCGCLILLLLLVAIVVLVVTLIFRPAPTWNPLKQFLNDDFAPGNVEDYTDEQTIDFINSSISSSQTGTIKLNETQITSLFRSRLGENTDIRVEFEPDTLRVVSDLDGASDVPLWLIVEFKETQSSFGIDKAGFGRFQIPEQLESGLNSIILNLVNLTQGDISGNQSAESIINALIQGSLSADIEVDDVKFLNNELEIKYSDK